MKTVLYAAAKAVGMVCIPPIEGTTEERVLFLSEHEEVIFTEERDINGKTVWQSIRVADKLRTSRN